MKAIPYQAVSIDDDGIWYSYLGKAKGLVHWDKICRMKERNLNQRLELQDINGNELIKLEHQLVGFELIRIVLHDKVNLLEAGHSQSTFSKNLSFHVLHWGAVVLAILVGYYLVQAGKPIMGVSSMVIICAFIGYEYLSSATSVSVTNTGFAVGYPFRQQHILFSDVTDIALGNSAINGRPVTTVWIITTNRKKPHELRHLDVDMNLVFQVLRAAKMTE
ncbi:hypothetical protein G3R49_00210 [Shewanella sp. WXL01]|nr:hypothetical protein [Shewanella sp. WXL01]